MFRRDAPGSFGRRPPMALILALGLLLFVWTVRWQATSPLFGFLVTDRVNTTTTTTSGSTGADKAISTTSSSGIGSRPGRPQANDAIDLSDPDAPFIGWPLKRVCDEVEAWTPGVVFVCDNNFGGVGNMRNFILNCIRYAIEAGSPGIVMPRIMKRDDDDISLIVNTAAGHRPFSYLFDEQNFRQAMGENCPQITLYNEITDVPHVRYVYANTSDSSTTLQPDVEQIDPRAFNKKHGAPRPDSCDIGEPDHHAHRFNNWFRQFVTDPSGERAPASVENPRLFRGADTTVLWQWPVHVDGPEFANTFGAICKFNPDVMRLGKKALASMQAYARQVNLDRAFTDHDLGGHNKTDDEHRLDKKEVAQADMSKYLGMHLRTEADAEPFWPTYEEQEEAYLNKAMEMNLSVAYVASGSVNDVRRLTKAAAEKAGLLVVGKKDILDEESLQELNALSWDQQGLVDYVVLTGSEYFMGNSRSSFSISVSLKRNLREDGIYTRPYQVRKKGWGRNFAVGPQERYYDHWLFIWDAMWP